MKKLITLLLVLTGMVSTAYAGASWIGTSYVKVNSTWYKCSGTNSEFATGGAFNNANLGSISSLTIGGQIQAYAGEDWKSGYVILHYFIDKGKTGELSGEYNLNYIGYNGSGYTNNMLFESVGKDIDIRSLSLGTHTLSVCFGPIDGQRDPAGETYYEATFTKVAYNVSGATITGVSDTDWTGSVIHPVPVVKIGDITLTSGTDYSVSYSEGCVEVGDYTVTITGLASNFTGTKSVDFKIKLPDGYYLVRNSNSWVLHPSNKLTQNSSNTSEYYIRNIVLSADDEIKVIQATNNAGTTVWYPGGSDPNFRPGKGTYDIYCRPDGKGGDGWHYGTLYASAQSSVDVALAPTGYGTYYNGACEATLPSGAAAYILKDATPSYEKIADGDGATKTIPAGTAVLLYGASSPITLTLSTATTDNRTFATNKLCGSDVSTTTTGGSTYYKLTYDNTGTTFGWYWGATSGAAFTSPAHKAWLALPAAASRSFLGLPDDDNTTGISSVESKQQDVNSVWYDLNGRRVIAPTSKGIYVKDGRKVVIK